MLSYASSFIFRLAIAAGILIAPIGAIAGGVVTEGMTASGEEAPALSLVNSAFGIYTGDQVIVAVNEDPCNTDDESAQVDETDEACETEEAEQQSNDDDTTDDALYLWMSNVLGGHDAALDNDSNVEGDFESSDAGNNSDESETQIATAGGCTSLPASSLSLLLGVFALARRRVRN